MSYVRLTLRKRKKLRVDVHGTGSSPEAGLQAFAWNGIS